MLQRYLQTKILFINSAYHLERMETIIVAERKGKPAISLIFFWNITDWRGDLYSFF
jgi:hypothetical protein